MSPSVRTKIRRVFFLYLPTFSVIVILVTIKKEKEQPRPKFVLSPFPLHRPCPESMSQLFWPLYSSILMIRKNALFCKLIRIKKSSKSLFDSYMDSFRPEKQVCPVCASFSNCHIHAYYGRRIVDFIYGVPVTMMVTVLRLVCDSCGHTHAVLPDMIIPYSGYGLFFILRVLAEAFLRISSLEHLCERFSITRNQFYKWKKLWNQHKLEWLGLLDASCTSDLEFLLKITVGSDYSSFAAGFLEKTAFSFLQSHSNPFPRL